MMPQTRLSRKWLRCGLMAMLALTALAVGCGRKADVKEIDFSDTAAVSTPLATEKDENVIRFAIAAVISPKKTFSFYQEMLDYVGEALKKRVVLVQRRSYRETNELIKSGHVDVALVCTGAYVEGRDECGMELLVAPECNGAAAYYSYIIVRRDSGIASVAQLRGRTFAFTDPLSNSGKLFPTFLLAKLGETPESFFKEHIFTYSHDNSIYAVRNRLVHGAAVDSLVYDYEAGRDSSLASDVAIVAKSPPFGINPVVVSQSVNGGLKARLKEVFLGMDKDPRGKAIMKKIMVDRFVPAEDAHYDSVRQMRAVAEQQARTGKPG